MQQKIEKGIYRHFKYNPEGIENNYTYEVIGSAIHSETEEELVIYKPLYQTDFVQGQGFDFCARPLKNFLEEIERDGKKMKRFSKVSDL